MCRMSISCQRRELSLLCLFFFTWIPILILFDLFCHTFTVEALTVPQQGGKTNSKAQKRHSAYVTRFKYLANMFVVIRFQYVGLTQMNNWPKNEQLFGASVCFTHFFPPQNCHFIIGLKLMTPITHPTVEVVLIFSVVAFSLPSTYLLTEFSSCNKRLSDESRHNHLNHNSA